MSGKVSILHVFGLLALVIFIMPNATAKFALQHRFVNGSDVNCMNCHTSIHSEITSGGVHTAHGFTNYPCRSCYITEYAEADTGVPSTSSYYNSYGGDTDKFHAAALVECTICHFNNPECTTCHIKANVTAEFENANIEAHHSLYYMARNASGVDKTDMLAGVNEACILCHTNSANVTIIEPTQHLNITANYSECTEGVDSNCYMGWDISFSISTS